MTAQRKVLVTGARGMVGQNILEHPSMKTWEVLAPSRAELDLTRFDLTLQYVREHLPDVIVHAAGRVGGIQTNIANPVDFLVTNLDVGRNIIMAARDAGVPRLLNLGSSCMYPRDAPNPLREEVILSGALEPTNEGYALAKIMTAKLCEYIGRESSAFEYKTLIPCNLYGRYDKFSPAHSHLIPAIIHKLHTAKIEEATTVDIWGDGTARREFMYAGDFADAIIYALGNFQTLPDMMNVGLGYDYAINDYYAATAEVVGWHGRFVHDLKKPVGMQQKLVSIDRQKAWGWCAPTTLTRGVERTYEYYLAECAV